MNQFRTWMHSLSKLALGPNGWTSQPEPRTKANQLPPVEQLEKRLYLGGMAASSLGDFAADDLYLADESDLVADIQLLDKQDFGEIEAAASELPAELENDVDTESNANRGDNLAADIGVSPTSGTSSSLQSALTAALTKAMQSGLESGITFTPEASPESGVQDPSNAVTNREEEQDLSANANQAAASGTSTITTDTTAAASQSLSSGGIANGMAEEVTADAGDLEQLALLQPDAAQLDAGEVQTLLQRASAATASQDAIIAIVDRNGRILGVRVEDDVLANIPDQETLVFAIDGAVAKARTAALFANGEFRLDDQGDPLPNTLAPLTSRTVRFISQTTNTEREIDSNPNVDRTDLGTALASTERGPGFVAPIGLGGHFPPEVFFTPPVDLFAIEHTNRDSNDHPGADGIRGTGDEITLRTSGIDDTGMTLGRFNIDPATVSGLPSGPTFVDSQALYAPESYGHSDNGNLFPDAQSRGVATLPGGIPIYRDSDEDGLGDTLIGGIGVFFPGTDGTATFEQNFQAGIGQTEKERTNAPKVLEAEYIALAAIGGSVGAEAWIPGARFGDIDGIAPVDRLDLPFGRLDLVGITLEVVGPGSGKTGYNAVLNRGNEVGVGTVNGTDMRLRIAPETEMTQFGFYRAGKAVPEQWLVNAHNSPNPNPTGPSLTQADVSQIIDQAIAAANETRAAVRLPLGSRTRMVFSVADTNGEILGLYRMENATTFSIDVAVAKSRNTAYYADADDLQAIDQARRDGEVVDAGVAFTNRTFRFLAEPRYPSGIDRTDPSPFSILNDGNINQLTGENAGAPDTVAEFDSVKGNDAFFPHDQLPRPGRRRASHCSSRPQSRACQSKRHRVLPRFDTTLQGRCAGRRLRGQWRRCRPRRCSYFPGRPRISARTASDPCGRGHPGRCPPAVPKIPAKPVRLIPQFNPRTRRPK